MPRPTRAEAERLKERITSLLEQGLSTSQIGRMTGKSAQAVHEYLTNHGLETVEMRRRRESKLDKVKASEEKGA